MPRQDKTRQDKTRQDKTRQAKTKTRHQNRTQAFSFFPGNHPASRLPVVVTFSFLQPTSSYYLTMLVELEMDGVPNYQVRVAFTIGGYWQPAIDIDIDLDLDLDLET